MNNAIYLAEEEAAGARRAGFIEEYMRNGWELGQTIDIYMGPHNIGAMGTIVEVQGNRCVIEIW